MSVSRIHQIGCIAVLLLAFSHTVEAKDMVTLQTAVSYAWKDMEKAKAEHDASVQTANQQRQIVEERKKQLDEESKRLDDAQKDTARAWKQYLEAKQKYEKAQSDLDKAWGKK